MGHGGGGHGGTVYHGGSGYHGGGYHNGGYHNGGYYHNGHHHDNFFFGFGFGYPWFYPGYYAGYGYGPYYGGGYYYGDNAPGYYDYAPSYASTYSYPTAAQTPALTTAPQTLPQVNENAIYIRVQVPADAEVWFEGQKTTQTGPVRFFESPSLTPGRKYVYHIKARWTENGKVVEREREFPVYAGDKFSTDFTKLNEGVPPRPPAPAGS
jgi:uncharacterized protein (TIGR03000 family)